MHEPGEHSASGVAGPWFATTHWSEVVAAGDGVSPGSEQALEALCRAYWYPLYAYVRRRGYSVEEAQDLTQEFFARLLRNDYFSLADRKRGRFRTFLLTALQRFLVSDWRRSQAAKRGGAKASLWDDTQAEARYLAEPSTELTPEKIFEKRWAISLLEQVLQKLHEEAISAGKAKLFDGLKSLLWGGEEAVSYADLSGCLNLSEGALRIAAMRFRQRYRELLRAEIAQTVVHPSEIDEELRHLFEVLG